MAEKPTIDDVARLAGVSKATVSRVLNHKPDVAPETRERILRVVEEVGFVPNITASGLAGGKSRLIGVLVPSFSWPFIPDIVRGVAEVVAETNYELVLYSINEHMRAQPGHRNDVINHILATKLTAGVLAIFPGAAGPHVARLHHEDFPVVIVDDQTLPPAIPWVGADNRQGAYLAVRYLLQLGHTRIAHIQGPMRYLCSQERHNGYCFALHESGLEADPELIVEGDFVQIGGRRSALQLFSLPEEKRPTAVFAASDLMAYGVYAAAEECGLRIPEDVAVVGFDDLTSSAHIRPSLTTVSQPFSQMGASAIKLLLSMLEASSWSHQGMPMQRYVEKNEPVRIQLATTLTIRDSSGVSYHRSVS